MERAWAKNAVSLRKLPLKDYWRASVFVRNYRLRFVPLILLSLISTALSLAQPYFTKLLIDDGLSRRNFRAVVLFTVWMGVCSAASFAIGMLTTYLYTKLSAAILFDMRLTGFRKLQALSPEFYAKTKTGDIVSRLNNDIGELQRLSADTLLSVPTNLLFLAGNAAMLFYLSWRLSLVGIALLPAALWAMQMFQDRLHGQIRTMRERSSEIGSFLIESILGMRLLVSSNAGERKNRQFRERNQGFVDSLLAMQLTSFLSGALPGAVVTLSIALLFLYGGHLVIGGAMSLGSLMAFMAYHGRLLSPIQSMMASYSALITGSVSLARVLELLDQPEAVREALDAAPVPVLSGHVRLQNVSFQYENRQLLLRDVTFDLLPGTTSVLVGASGSGKSTIADLLLRFYDPHAGVISIDGHDFKKLRFSDLRRHVALVEQVPFFFHASVRDNLLFAAPEASAADLEAALIKAEIFGFLQSLPDGLSTMLGERGLVLSVGQRQRLAIARALLRKPTLLILDEPSAALDPAAEFQLGETLRRFSRHCTLLIVTHRAALVSIADRAIVLHEGTVAEFGDCQTLLRSDSALSRHFADFALKD